MLKSTNAFRLRGRALVATVFGALGVAFAALAPLPANAHWNDGPGWYGPPRHHHRYPPPHYGYYPPPPPPVVGFHPPVILPPPAVYGPPVQYWQAPPRPGVSLGITVPFR